MAEEAPDEEGEECGEKAVEGAAGEDTTEALGGDGLSQTAPTVAVVEPAVIESEPPSPPLLPPSPLPSPSPQEAPLTPRPVGASVGVGARPASPVDSPVPISPATPQSDPKGYEVADVDAAAASAAAAAAAAATVAAAELRIADIQRKAEAEGAKAKAVAEEARKRASEMDDELRAARDDAKLVRRQNEELRDVLHNMYRQQEFERERAQANAARSGRAVEMLAEAHTALLTSQKELETQLLESRAQRATDATRAQQEIEALRTQLASKHEQQVRPIGATVHSATKPKAKAHVAHVTPPSQSSRSVNAAKSRLHAAAGASAPVPSPQPKPQHPSRAALWDARPFGSV